MIKKTATLVIIYCLLAPAAGAGPAGLRQVTQRKGEPAKSPPQVDRVPRRDAPEILREADSQVAPILLEELRLVAKDTKKWEDAAAAARVQSQVADLIWSFDPERARGYLTEAWEATDRIKATENYSQYINEPLKTKVRSEVLLVAKRHAPELARDWVARMDGEGEGAAEKPKRGAFDDRSQRSAMLLQTALHSLESDPEAAATLAVESLRDGISFGLGPVLVGLQSKDFKLAERVFHAALLRLKTVGMFDPGELLILYGYLYTPGRALAVNTTERRESRLMSMDRNQSPLEPAAKRNPSMAAEFLKIASDLLLNAPAPSTTSDPPTAARSLVSVIDVILGKIAQQSPESAALLRARRGQLEADARFLPPSTARADRTSPGAGGPEEIRDSRVTALEKEAEREANPLRRDTLYVRASLTAAVGDHERGLRLADKVRDEGLRTKVTNFLIYRHAVRLTRAGELEKARAIIADNSDPVQRAACMILGAQRLIQAKDLTHARLWLQEARSTLLKAEPDEDAARVALGMVSAYGRLDPGVTLEILADAVRVLNRLPGSVKDGETAPFSVPVTGILIPHFTSGTEGFSLSAAAGAIQPDQLVVSLNILKEIKHPETRGTFILNLGRKYRQFLPHAAGPQRERAGRSEPASEPL